VIILDRLYCAVFKSIQSLSLSLSLSHSLSLSLSLSSAGSAVSSAATTRAAAARGRPPATTPQNPLAPTCKFVRKKEFAPDPHTYRGPLAGESHTQKYSTRLHTGGRGGVTRKEHKGIIFLLDLERAQFGCEI